MVGIVWGCVGEMTGPLIEGLMMELGMRRRITACAIAASLLPGCATQSLERRDFKSYTVGEMMITPPGGTLLAVQGGSVEKVKRWVGILNSPDGWQEDTRNSADYLRKELIYGGVSGTTIEISYREYRGGLAAPAFFQSLKYDLKDSKIITFQNFRFDVLGATNSGMTARLLSDR